MATLEQIQQHDNVLNSAVDTFEKGINAVLDSLFGDIVALGANITRSQILSVFQPVNEYVRSQILILDTVANSNVDINSDVIQAPLDAQLINTLKQETYITTLNQVETEQNRIVEILVLAAIAGAVSVDLIRQTKRTLTASAKRISTVFGDAVFRFDTILTRVRSLFAGVKRFRYVGGTIATTRDFCRSHNNKVYTEIEIKRIWRSSWGGKAPGDPFVVRGGYNCRHWWVPVSNEENTSV
jgi:hypothetical protein